jgi:hypothetical protein
LDVYSKTTAIVADHLKIDTSIHKETPEIKINIRWARARLERIYVFKKGEFSQPPNFVMTEIFSNPKRNDRAGRFSRVARSIGIRRKYNAFDRSVVEQSDLRE